MLGLPIIVIRRLECVLVDWLEKKAAEVRKNRPKLDGTQFAKLIKELELNPKQVPVHQQDGALLFLQTMLAKMAQVEEGGSRIAIIFNGSPLSNGNCGSGESEIRRWILENDWLDAIIMLPGSHHFQPERLLQLFGGRLPVMMMESQSRSAAAPECFRRIALPRSPAEPLMGDDAEAVCPHAAKTN